MAFDYKAGDRIRIFEGHGGYITGEVTKVTPSGQIVVKTPHGERRFTAKGRESGKDYGGWDRHCPYILTKVEGELHATKLQAEAKRSLRRRTFRDACELLARNDPTDDREAVLAELQRLIDFVKGA